MKKEYQRIPIGFTRDQVKHINDKTTGTIASYVRGLVQKDMAKYPKPKTNVLTWTQAFKKAAIVGSVDSVTLARWCHENGFVLAGYDKNGNPV